MAVRTEPVRLLAPAKLTLSLRITGTRPDGYHLIDAEMVTLDLCDELLIRPAPESSVEIVTLYRRRQLPAAPATAAEPPAAEAPGESAPQARPAEARPAAVPTDRSNLVIRALELAGRTAHVEIRKRIPPGAGLGGGSADAAAVLRWANGLTAAESLGPGAEPDAFPGTTGERQGEPAVQSAKTGKPAIVTPQQAAALGADVAFCLVGGRARVTGIGEIVEPLPFRDQSFVLWTPPVHVDTAAVYRTWDELGGPSGDQSNDLEPAALALHSELAVWRDELARASGRRPQLAGSGGTWFVGAPVGTNVTLPTRGGVRASQARTARPL